MAKKRKPFRLPERIVTLFFEDGPYVGLELDVRLRAPMSVFWQFAGASEIDEPNEVRDLCLQFADSVLVGWNLEDRNGPVPCTPEAFADRLDQVTQAQIMARWVSAVSAVPAPLASPSPSTDTSAAE